MATRTLTPNRPGVFAFVLKASHGHVHITISDECETARVVLTGEQAAVDRATERLDGSAWHVDVGDDTAQPVRTRRGHVTNTISGGVFTNEAVIQAGDIHFGAEPASAVPAPMGDLEVQVTLSAEFSVETDTRTAFVVMTGYLNFLHHKGTTGRLEVEYVEHANIHTNSGNVTLGRTESVTVTTIGGGITITDFGGTAELSTVTGDVTVHANAPGTVDIDTASGDIRVTETERLANAVEDDRLIVIARTKTGRVEVPPQTSAPTRRRRSRD